MNKRFRISNRLNLKLKEESIKKNISENELVSGILLDYFFEKEKLKNVQKTKIDLILESQIMLIEEIDNKIKRW